MPETWRTSVVESVRAYLIIVRHYKATDFAACSKKNTHVEHLTSVIAVFETSKTSRIIRGNMLLRPSETAPIPSPLFAVLGVLASQTC